MSRKTLTIVESSEFVNRFCEACGTVRPAEIARLLNVSYQAAKNYLQGRIPESTVLIAFSEQTPYSLHWLLTGKGEKFVQNPPAQGTPILSDQFKALIKEECRKNAGELLSHSKENAQEKVIVLRTEDIKDEKVIESTDTSSKVRK